MKNMNKKSIIFGLILLLGTSIFAQSIKFSAKDIDGKNVSEKVFHFITIPPDLFTDCHFFFVLYIKIKKSDRVKLCLV